jgi:hypothetical protein
LLARRPLTASVAQSRGWGDERERRADRSRVLGGSGIGTPTSLSSRDTSARTLTIGLRRYVAHRRLPSSLSTLGLSRREQGRLPEQLRTTPSICICSKASNDQATTARFTLRATGLMNRRVSPSLRLFNRHHNPRVRARPSWGSGSPPERPKCPFAVRERDTKRDGWAPIATTSAIAASQVEASSWRFRALFVEERTNRRSCPVSAQRCL